MLLPSYSDQPTNGEERLDYTPRPQAARLRHSAVYIKNSGDLNIVLNSQEENVTTPVFGLYALISGTVLLSQGQLDSIREIVLKVEGKLDSESSLGGSRSTELVNDSYTLWSHITTEQPCHPQVPFSARLPSIFQDGDRFHALPPSYDFKRLEGFEKLFVKSAYQLHFIVTRVRHQKIQDIWLKKQHIIIPFKYVPRIRPPRPIVATPYFFLSVKRSPEEWHQTVTSLEVRHTGIEMGPIICHLFVPAGRIYGLKDSIKFHIQLTGLSRSLNMLFSATDLDCVTSANSDSYTAKKNQRSSIHVILLRQVFAMIRGANSYSDLILGEGTIWPIPPDLTSCGATITSLSSQSSEGNIDWDGEVRCRDDVTVGGFHAANVRVKDSIVLTISPQTLTSPLLLLKVTVPVRLVTDSFSDIVLQMDSGAL
jgi:hypothetical protein